MVLFDIYIFICIWICILYPFYVLRSHNRSNLNLLDKFLNPNQVPNPQFKRSWTKLSLSSNVKSSICNRCCINKGWLIWCVHTHIHKVYNKHRQIYSYFEVCTISTWINIPASPWYEKKVNQKNFCSCPPLHQSTHFSWSRRFSEFQRPMRH